MGGVTGSGVSSTPMARQEIITDDLTGEPNARQVYIAVNSEAWTIDLADSGRAKLDKALAPFLAKATPVRQSSPKRAKTGTTGTATHDIADVRAWAKKKKIALPARGRIPGAILQQYRTDTGR
jgi:hypothetical protein